MLSLKAPRKSIRSRSLKRFVSYSLPKISLLDNLRLSQRNLTGLFSNKAVNELWFGRGQVLIQGLNHTLEDNQLKNPPSDLNNLIATTINKPELYAITSYASLLHNLQFFFESLKVNENEAADTLIKVASPESILQTPTSCYGNVPSDENLKSWIIDSFGSVAEFRTLLLSSAKAIKGDGYTWVVAESNMGENSLRNASSKINSSPTYSNLLVVNTYNAGVPDDSIRSGQMTKLQLQKEAKLAAQKKKSEERRNIEGAQDPNTTDADSENLQSDEMTLGTVAQAEAATLFKDRKLLPLLSIDASSRNYLLDYGVFGKQAYLDNVWECIDWSVVASRAPPRTKQFVKID